MFPYYLSIGMTYEQYWEQDCELVRYYRKAAEIRQSLMNQEAWLQGAYFYEALLSASPVFHDFAKRGTKPVPYRDSPYNLFQRYNDVDKEKKKEKADEKAREYFQALAISLNKKFQKKGGGVNGGQCGNAGD